MNGRRTMHATLVVVALLAAACGKGASGEEAGTTVEVTLQEMTISPAEIQAPAGAATTIHVTNAGQAEHAFAVDAGGRTIQTPSLAAGAEATIDVPALTVGSYAAWCTIAGHREAGMTASLVVGAVGETQAAANDAMSSMSAEDMSASHQRGIAAFPAQTEGVGNQPLEARMDGDVKVFSVAAEQVRWEVSPGETQDAFGFNGQIPGPQIRVRKGDRVRIVLENRLPQPTTVHFHGVTVPNEMDGVPFVTQDPVMPGRHFIYEFDVVDGPGTYMYHSHFNSTEQVGRGLYGAFVIEPKDPAWDVEETVFLGDGPLGYTLNGKGFPATAPFAAKLGDKVLIRMANAGQLLHPMHLHGYHFEVVAQDGFSLKAPYMADTLVVAPGERFDVLVDATLPGTWAFHCHILSHAEDAHGMFGMVTALVVG